MNPILGTFSLSQITLTRATRADPGPGGPGGCPQVAEHAVRDVSGPASQVGPAVGAREEADRTRPATAVSVVVRTFLRLQG